MDDITFWNAPTMDDVRAGEDKKLFTHVSLFAGLGGSSTGMRLAGAHTLGISEFIDYRNEIYSRNYPHCPVWNEDIRTLSGEEILKRIGLKKGELDLLDGSPPCLTEESLVITKDGPLRIGELVCRCQNGYYDDEDVYVKTLNVDTNRVEYKKVLNAFCSGQKQTYYYIFGNGKEGQNISLHCTPDHPIWSIDDEEYKQAQNFIIGNRVEVFINNKRTILRYLEHRESSVLSVYDIVVSDNHNFYADGILVHNCSDFSTNNMGKRESHWGHEKKYSNTTQRVDDLFYEFARVLKEVQPKVFVAENVKGLTTGNAKTILGDRSKSLQSLLDIEEEENTSDVFKFNGKDETIVQTLRDCGYKVSFQILNCAEYGIPQIRERLIFIGIRNDLPYLPSFPKPTTSKNRIIGKNAVGNFLFNGGNVLLNPETMTYDYVKKYFPPHTTKLEVLNTMRKNGFGTYAHRYHRDNWDKVFYTVVAQDGNNVIHSIVDRYWSVCEVKKIQSFPDDFIDGLPPFKRIKVSANQLLDPDFVKTLDYMWKDQGHQSGDIRKIIELARWKWDDVKDQKIFDLDLKTEYDTSVKYLHSSRSWENIGRAVPPLLYKAVGEHVYNNVLKYVKDK